MNFFNILTSLVATTTTMIATVSSVTIDNKEVKKQSQLFQQENPILNINNNWTERLIHKWENSNENNFKNLIIEEEVDEEEFDSSLLESDFETINYDEGDYSSFWQNLAKKAKYEIKKLFVTIAQKDNTYHQLFAPKKGELVKFRSNSNKNSTDLEHFIFNPNKNDIFKDRQIFRLNQIIKAKIEPKFQFSNLKAFEFHLEDVKHFMFSVNEEKYTIKLKIKLIKNDNILIKEWTEKFQWEANKAKQDHIRHHHSNNALIRKAKNFCLNINKKMFSVHKIFNDGKILLHYMNNQLTSISPDFSIIVKENIALPLKEINVQGSVYLKDNQIFNFILTESSSHVNFVSNHNHKNKTKIHKIRKNHKLEENFKYRIDDLLQQTGLKYNDLLAKFDHIGLIISASEAMKNQLYPYEFAKQIHITTNLEDNKQLSSIIMENGNLNFTWIAVTNRGVFTYDNSKLQKIKYHDRTWDLQGAIHINRFDPNENDFLLTRRDMVKFLGSKLQTAGASLFIKDDLDHLSLKDQKFQVAVYQRFYDDSDNYHENRVGIISYNPFVESRKLFFLYFRKNEILPTIN